MRVYQKFAQVYDKIGSDQFSARMYQYSRRLLNRLDYRPKTMLDLACGTGTAAIMWAENNISTFGIDGSDQMLLMARKKARECGSNITFSRQSMTAFTMPQKVDLVTCYFDSLNYLLTLADLTACFKSVRRSLYNGGYFIFDVNTPEAMKVIWDSQVYADETSDVAWIWKNTYYPKVKRAKIRATFFVRQGKVWERFEETHSERGYNVTEVKKVLKASGLKPVNIYECLTFVRPNRKTMRLAVVARKQ